MNYVSLCEITTLDHKIRDDTVEYQIVEEGLACLGALRQRYKILNGLWRLFGKKLGFELAFRGIEQRVRLIRHMYSIVSPVILIFHCWAIGGTLY